MPRSTQLPNVLVDDLMPRLKGAAFKVLVALVRQTFGWGHTSIEISQSKLGELTGLSNQSVIDGIKELDPVVTVARSHKNSRIKTIYTVNVDISTGKLVNFLDQSNFLTSQNSRLRPVQKVDTLKPLRETTNKRALKSVPNGKRLKPDSLQIEAFDQFYSAYPRHTARENALKAWLKLNPNADLRAVILTAVRTQKWPDGDERKFIPYPAKWLNDKRLQDEPSGGAANGGAPAFIELPDGSLQLTANSTKISRREFERRYGKINLGGRVNGTATA